MEVYRRSSWLLLLLGVSLLATTLQGVQGEAEFEGPSECRPYIEKALKELGTGETSDIGTSDLNDSKEDLPTIEITTDDTEHDGEDDTREESEQNSVEDTETNDDQITEQEDTQMHASEESKEDSTPGEETHEEEENKTEESAETDDKKSEEVVGETESHEQVEDEQELQQDQQEQDTESNEVEGNAEVDDKESQENQNESNEETKSEKEESQEQITTQESQEDTKEDDKDSKEDTVEETAESIEDKTESKEDEIKESVETDTAEEESVEQQPEIVEEDAKSAADDGQSTEDDGKSAEDEGKSAEDDGRSSEKTGVAPETVDNNKESEDQEHQDSAEQKEESVEEDVDKTDVEEGTSEDAAPEEALGMDVEIPTELREREHVEHLLKLDDESIEIENVINRIAEITLRELKKIYENAIKPLETLYKYRDLSNRHFGDAEIFSKPLILFMGPWSGGKSSIINYLLNNEYNETSLRTGAEPSPAYFNIMMHGDEPEVMDGTQLAADFTFSGLQKFGQGLEERLRGIKLPSKLLEKVNIVEIPGILEVRKQVSRVFPFNDACQWFIDRADIIFLVYDPSKLDVGPETEAILDQLKGREHQTRIILNKADQVKPEELMRVQGALIWNISPLMSSAQPPIMYTTTLWSRPYEAWAPVRLLQAQERAFLRDLRSAIDKRIENKIASARRFAVRVRNHAKMVDCYLTTYYNHKSVFGNRKQVADQIIEHPQDYHIYEGLSTLTNISRYDLPDPDVYRDFFKLNPLYDFQQLSATCTYFRGCPINRLDIAIAYDLPELVGKHKRLVESALAEINQTPES